MFLILSTTSWTSCSNWRQFSSSGSMKSFINVCTNWRHQRSSSRKYSHSKKTYNSTWWFRNHDKFVVDAYCRLQLQEISEDWVEVHTIEIHIMYQHISENYPLPVFHKNKREKDLHNWHMFQVKLERNRNFLQRLPKK